MNRNDYRMTRNSPYFRRWYRRARRAFPSLPPVSQVRFLFQSLPNNLATVKYDRRGDRLTNVTIRIDSDLQWMSKLVLREVAHEVAHLAKLELQHGAAFERLVVRVKTAMERDPAWY